NICENIKEYVHIGNLARHMLYIISPQGAVKQWRAEHEQNENEMAGRKLYSFKIRSRSRMLAGKLIDELLAGPRGGGNG
ncbi:MAG: hypothetical protein WC477_07095, partial [Patescibacteria group bacterium]